MSGGFRPKWHCPTKVTQLSTLRHGHLVDPAHAPVCSSHAPSRVSPAGSCTSRNSSVLADASTDACLLSVSDIEHGGRRLGLGVEIQQHIVDPGVGHVQFPITHGVGSPGALSPVLASQHRGVLVRRANPDPRWCIVVRPCGRDIVKPSVVRLLETRNDAGLSAARFFDSVGSLAMSYSSN